MCEGGRERGGKGWIGDKLTKYSKKIFWPKRGAQKRIFQEEVW